MTAIANAIAPQSPTHPAGQLMPPPPSRAPFVIAPPSYIAVHSDPAPNDSIELYMTGVVHLKSRKSASITTSYTKSAA